MKSVVAIIGRPNVGKSTLFNRLSGGKRAIVIDEPGATRDRNYADCLWNGKPFILIDTGGFEPASTEKILIQMREQASLAIEEADVILFILDGRDGLLSADIEIAGLLRTVTKPVFFIVNKVDGPKQQQGVYDFYRLGVERLYSLSALEGSGLGDLMDDVADHLTEAEERTDDERIGIAVIGKPNVGKSSLVNRFLGYERTIVNPEAGTTRDAIDTPFDWEGRKYLLIDTAGIRRKSRIQASLEKHSIVQALRAIDRCDVALLLIDAMEGITEQDAKIAGLTIDKGAAGIIVVNKWDGVEKDDRTIGKYVKDIKDQLKFMDFAPIIFISALTGQRVPRIFALVERVYAQYTRRIGTGELNKGIRDFLDANPPSRHRGRENKFLYVTQAAVKPPTFVFFVQEPTAVHFSYERYLANRIRETFALDLVPIRLIFRKRSRQTD
ncbi:MAG: ribosome biogenesis GTPase Der [Deltaproteobacteria bacterium]|nr:ribosome biogenesis GTPase Der [Deltaproteobacteria bacterium]